MTRIQHGPYVAYHYVREAADQLTDLLNKHAEIIDRETGVRELLKDKARLDWMGQEGAQWDRYDQVLAEWYEGVPFRDAVDSAMSKDRAAIARHEGKVL